MGSGARRANQPGEIAPQPAADELVHVLLHHHAALEYDWTHLFGFGLAELVADRVSVARAVALTAGVLDEPDSHTVVALRAAHLQAQKSTPAQLKAQQANDDAWARGEFDPTKG